MCLEENCHFVLYLTCSHAVICPSCEIQVAFTRFTRLVERQERDGELQDTDLMTKEWFGQLVMKNPRRFQFSCVRCQRLCPIERRVYVSFQEDEDDEEK